MRAKTAICGVVIVAIGLLAACGCQKSEAAGGMPQLPPPLVVVAKARAQDVPVYLDEIGRCTATETVTVTPQISGQIIQRHFEDGADLKKDQLVFTIDPRPFKAQLDLAQAQLAQAKAALDLSHIQLNMYSAVADTRAISKSDFDTKKNAVDVADAQVEAAQAAVETAKLNLDYCTVRSPIDGRAGQRLVDAGNVVQANMSALLLVQHLDPIYADFIITERDLPEVQRQMAQGMLKAMVRLPSDDPKDARSGDLTFLDNQVQDGTGTVKLRATISNPAHHFWPGQFVNVRLILTIYKDAVLVPSPAPQISQQGPYVYVLKSDGTPEMRSVTLGQRQGDDIVLTHGVAAGERVVVTGQQLVQPGGKVRIDTGAPEDQASTAPTEVGKP